MTSMPKDTSPMKDTGMNGTAHPAAQSARAHNQRVTVVLPTALIERLRNAVYWTGESTLARYITDPVEDTVTALEHANGGPFAPRLSPLKRGRPARKPSARALPRSRAATARP